MKIQSRRIWIADQFTAAILDINNGKITGILPYGSQPVDIDYGDLRIVPGFLDIHCHGAYGFDTNDVCEEGLRRWARRLPEEGVTAFLPTTVTQSEAVLTKSLANVSQVMQEGCEGAEILGVHLEGPFLNPAHKGAQTEAWLVTPSVEQFLRFQAAASGNIRYVTLAPELDDRLELTHYLVENGIVVSVGHSAATYDQAVMAYAHGVRSVTHVYNGMAPFHHRENGLVGAALRIRSMYGEVICDGQHVTPTALNQFFLSKGPDYAIMISDSLLAKGAPSGSKYLFGGHEIEICPDGSAKLAGTDTLAGSTLKLNEGLRLLVEEALVPFHSALNACTCNPARLLGLDKRKGSIGVGMDADLVVLEQDYRIRQTYCAGQAQLP